MERESVVVFTEDFNATYVINFAAPFGSQTAAWGEQSGVAMAAEQADALEPDALRARLIKIYDTRPVRLVVLSRYVGGAAMQVREFFAALGVPVALHIDDWLFDLPSDLGASYADRYGPRFRSELQRMIECVDAVLCSTPALAERTRDRAGAVPVHVLPGIWYRPSAKVALPIRSRLVRLRQRLRQHGKCVIGYAGSRSHHRDLQLVVPALHRVMAERPNTYFQTFGIGVPRSLAELYPDRVASVGFTRDYGSYLRALYELAWDIGLAPLIDDEFNRCKTATKLSEYTSCGLPALCADVEPYRRVWAVLQDSRQRDLVGSVDGWAEELLRWVDEPTIRRVVLERADQALRVVGADCPANAILRTFERVLPPGTGIVAAGPQ